MQTENQKAKAAAPANSDDKSQSNSSASQVDVAQIQAEARASERARISGIMGCEEAVGRATLANHLATTTDMSVEAAKGILAASPKEKAEEKAKAKEENNFAKAMNQSQHPDVGSDVTASGNQSGDADNVSALLSSYEAATGFKSQE